MEEHVLDDIEILNIEIFTHLGKCKSRIERILQSKTLIKIINENIENLRERLQIEKKYEIVGWISDSENKLNFYKYYLEHVERKDDDLFIDKVKFSEDILNNDVRIITFCELKEKPMNIKEEIEKLTKELSDLKTMKCSCRDQFDEFERSDNIDIIENKLFIYSYYLEHKKSC